MNDDYILRKDVLDAITALWKDYGADGVYKAVKRMPGVNSRAVRGRWIKTNNPNYSPFDSSQTYNAICSNCFYTSNQTYNYCPNCGAKNWGEKDGE